MKKVILITLISLLSHIQPSVSAATICQSRVPGECSQYNFQTTPLFEVIPKKPVQHYDRFGLPNICIGPGENEKVGPEILGEACIATQQTFDKYVCQTWSDTDIEIYFEFDEITNVTLFALGGVFVNVLPNLEHQSILKKMSVINSNAKKGEAIKIQLSSQVVLQELTTFPNWIKINYKGDPVPLSQPLDCQQEY